MNAEMMYFAAIELQNEFSRFDITKKISEIIHILEKFNRHEIQYREIKEVKEQVDKILDSTSVYLDQIEIRCREKNIRDILKEISISIYFGLPLKNRILETTYRILHYGNITGDKFNTDELSVIAIEIDNMIKIIANIASGLNFYENRKEMSGSCCEIILTIPRQQVEENLKNLGQELIDFEKNISIFSEIATGSREPVRVKNIASSDFSIFLESAPAIGACIAVAVERIIALYKNSLEIEKIKQEIKKNKVPAEAPSCPITPEEAEKIAAELMEQHAVGIEQSRKNELLIELRHSIENLAEKTGKGFQIEVSVAELGEEKKENSGQLTAEEIARKQIAESAKKISYPIASGEPIPALPEKKEGEDE